MGTCHEIIDLTQVKLRQDFIQEVAMERETSWTYLFDAFYHRMICKRYGKDAIFWSGFMGDALSGKHLPMKDSKTWEEAKNSFLRMSQFVRSIVLYPPSFKYEEEFPKFPFIDKEYLSYENQLDFVVRHQYYIKPTVVPEGYDYCTPFLNPDWVSFILNVPRRYKRNQYLYKEILKRIYPKLFSLPTKNSYGLTLHSSSWQLLLKRLSLGVRFRLIRILPAVPWNIHPMIDFIDFNRGLRERDDLKTLVYENIQDLKRRSIVDWINIEDIWKQHQLKRANYGDALTLLAALEINLKAKEAKY